MFRIALFSDYFLDKDLYGGGIGVVVASLAHELSKEGHEVYVFTAASCHRQSIKHYRNLHVFRYSSIARVFNTFISLDLLIKPLRHEADIVHVEGGIMATLSGLLYSLIKGKPLLITVHHIGDVWKDPIKNFISKLYDYCVLEIILKKACKIIIPSRYLVSQSKHLTRFKDKIVEIPNGVDVDSILSKFSKEEARRKLGLPPDVKIVLFVGALCKRKGMHILIGAAEKVVKEFPECLFIFIGRETEETRDFRKLIRDKGLEKNCKLLGYVSDILKKLYYRASDLFVLPSLSEGFGLVLLEAGVNGLPLVVSDLPVFKALVRNNYNGLFFKRGSIEDLAYKISYLLRNDIIRSRFCENSKNMATAYSWSKTASKTLKLYIQVFNQI